MVVGRTGWGSYWKGFQFLEEVSLHGWGRGVPKQESGKCWKVGGLFDNFIAFCLYLEVGEVCMMQAKTSNYWKPETVAGYGGRHGNFLQKNYSLGGFNIMTNFDKLVAAGKKWHQESFQEMVATKVTAEQEEISCQLYPEEWYLLEENFTRKGRV